MHDTSSFDAYLSPILFAREPRLADYDSLLRDFLEWVLGDVDSQANYTDRHAPPALETFDKDGAVVNRIVFNPLYDSQHREVYRRGIIGLPYSEGAPHSLSFAMGFLLSQADISLHCPVTLTGAVAYVLAYFAPEAIRSKYLHEVTRTDGLAKSGGTWATELHGGSDVGATTTTATRDGNRFRLEGLKWFTSNANSGLAVATARPDGAAEGWAGLGLYLVPSHLEDGCVNQYRIRRLKDKFGTKGLATGEIELHGAEAEEIAGPPHGFRLMMEALQYSRIHNAVGAAGVQRRALREAVAWAKSRKAFGHVLTDFPMVRDELLRMHVQFEASALLAFEAALAFDKALSVPEDRGWMRLTTALAKYLTAEYAIAVSRAALELIGGNAYTSDYPMARILRDAQVLTVWEGPANIQALELLRMLTPRYAGAALYETRVRGVIERLPAVLAAKLEARLSGDLEAIRIATASQSSGERLARRLLHRLSQSLALALMCEQAGEQQQGSPQLLTALRYFEEIEPPAFGSESKQALAAAMQIVDDEAASVEASRAA
jgi:alkylation response protein AidB-like acyl-CoA dehydrogenase